MKKFPKILAVLLSLTMLLSFSVLSASAETLTAGNDTVTYDDVIDLLPETKDNVWDCNGAQPARASGSKEDGWVLSNLSGWGANLCDTPEWEYSKGWMLYYDFEVDASSVGIYLQWWNVNVSQAIAEKHGVQPAGESGNHVPEGNYVGVLDLEGLTGDLNSTEATGEDVKWLLNIYLVQGRVTLNEMKLIHVTGQSAAPTTTTTKAPTTTTTEAPTTTVNDDADTTTTTVNGDADTTTTTVNGDADTAPTATTTAADVAAEDEGGLPTGAIVAIVAAAVIVVAGIAVVVYLVLKKKKA